MTFLTSEPGNSLRDSAPTLEAIALAIPMANTLDITDELIDALRDFDPGSVPSGAPAARAFMILSFLAHSYIWSIPGGRDEIPEALAAPWVALASRCGLPPVLTYSSYVLDNLQASLGCDEAVPSLTFTGGTDEIWFVRVHQLIERSGAGIVEIASRREANGFLDHDASADMETIATCLEGMCTDARRMPEHCDPYVYFHRVRQFLYGWKWNPSYTGRRMVYRGVAAVDLPSEGDYSGESGAQSPLIPLADAMLGVRHAEPFLSFSNAMRLYMYPAHRDLIANASKHSLPGGPSASDEIKRPYVRGLEALREFRSIHLDFAKTYVAGPANGGEGYDDPRGTGGSPFIAALSGARHAVEERLRSLG